MATATVSQSPMVQKIGDRLKGKKFGKRGFRPIEIGETNAQKLRQAQIDGAVWVAGSSTEGAIVYVGSSPDALSLHVQFPLTAPVPAGIPAQSLEGVLALGTFLPNSGLVLDPKERVAWNIYREYRPANPDQANADLEQLLEMRKRFDPRIFVELRNLGLSTDLSNETDLIEGSVEAAQPLVRGFVRSLVVGLALGVGSVIITGATGGVGTAVGVVGEAVYGAALS